MRWPWTSVARVDDALAQVAYLRAEVSKLTDTLTRLTRREMGMTEEPRPARPPLLPMPPVLKEHIESYADASLRKTMRDAAYRRHAQGASWDSIISDVLVKKEAVP